MRIIPQLFYMQFAECLKEILGVTKNKVDINKLPVLLTRGEWVKTDY